MGLPNFDILSKNQAKNQKNFDPQLKSLACLVLEIWHPEPFCDITGQNANFPYFDSNNMILIGYVSRKLLNTTCNSGDFKPSSFTFISIFWFAQ